MKLARVWDRPGAARSRVGAFLLFAVLVTGSARAARADYLLGVSDNGSRVIRIDPNTGQGVLVGNYGSGGPDSAEDIQTDAAGNLIVVGFVPKVNNADSFRTTFARLDPVTFAPTILGTARAYEFVEGLANVNGVLYGSASTKDSYAIDTADHLIRIDLATNTFTEVGKFGPQFLNVEDIAYSPIHGLIGVDIGTLDPATNFQTFHTMPALIRIDPTTGVATKIADLPPSSVQLVENPFNTLLSPYGPFLAGLDFAPDGTLYASTLATHFGGSSRLLKVDPLTGALTDVGDIGFLSIDGLIYVRSVPTPASLPCLVLGGVLTAIGARRRRGHPNPPTRD